MATAHHESTPISSFPLYIPLVAPSEIVDVVGEEVEIYMDEKWKAANKEIRNSRSGGRRVVAAAEEEGGPFLKRSASTREGRRRTTTIKTSRSFSSRCANQVKEQRARLYIMRRCVTMLVCWRDYH